MNSRESNGLCYKRGQARPVVFNLSRPMGWICGLGTVCRSDPTQVWSVGAIWCAESSNRESPCTSLTLHARSVFRVGSVHQPNPVHWIWVQIDPACWHHLALGVMLSGTRPPTGLENWHQGSSDSVKCHDSQRSGSHSSFGSHHSSTAAGGILPSLLCYPISRPIGRPTACMTWLCGLDPIYRPEVKLHWTR